MSHEEPTVDDRLSELVAEMRAINKLLNRQNDLLWHIGCAVKGSEQDWAEQLHS